MKKLCQKETLIALLFLLVILLPAADNLLKLDSSRPLNENRQLAKAPQSIRTSSEILKFPAAYTKYFNDHFGFRNTLVRANFIIRYSLLGVSPSAEITLGKDGWLFYNGEIATEDFQGIGKYDAGTLERWAKSLEMKRVWLEKRGIRYLFMVAPNKSTIYPEFLPAAYSRVIDKTALNKFTDYLEKHTKVEVVNIQRALMAEKPTQRLYHRTDTHWNEYGAFLAYTQIMKPIVEWFPGVKQHTLADYLLEKKTAIGGDLAGMIGWKEYFTEEYLNLKPKGSYSAQIESISDVTSSPVTVRHNDNSLPRALVFRDSFFSGVAPYLADHFHYSQYCWEYWNSWTPIEELLLTTRPDIVIEEIAERKITAGMADFVTTPPKFLGGGN